MTQPRTNNSTSLAVQPHELVAALASLKNSQQRLGWLVEHARRRPPMDAAFRSDEHRVEGCQVRLWFVPTFRARHCYFQADSDAVTLKALTGLLCDYYSDRTPDEILADQLQFLEKLALLRHLTENRRSTVLRVAEKIRTFAQAQLPARSAHLNQH